MSFANSDVTDIIATTLNKRSGKIRDNVTKNNALLARLSKKGNVKTFSGGRSIFEELSFAENANAGWYSGGDTLNVAAQDVISAAEFQIKQAAVAVTVTGLERLQNSGREAIIDLVDARVRVAEASCKNLIAEGIYSDGTGSNSKTITGLDLAVPVDPTTGTYGGINRANFTFWKSQIMTGTAYTSSNIRTGMNTMWAKLVRGADRPDLIVVDSVMWGLYLDSLQSLVQFTSTGEADMGFPSVKFMGADVVLDGGMGGFMTASTMFFLNTEYIYYRPHSEQNMTPLDPGRRTPFNQDVSAQIIGWAGNLTCGNASLQGRIRNS